MNGIVESYQILLDVPLRIAGRPDISIQFVVDTGFAGWLTLPVAALEALGLPIEREIGAILADDTTVVVNVHLVTILWHDEEQLVEVLAMGKNPLLGMRLLDGSEMNIQFADGGLVSLGEL